MADDSAEYRQQIAKESVKLKVRSQLIQFQSMKCSKVTYKIEQIKDVVEPIVNLPVTVVETLASAVITAVNDVMSLIDSAISAAKGLLQTILKQTAIAEKLNLINSEHNGLQKQTLKVSLGISGKVSNLKSVNDMIRYDNFAHTAIRINIKCEALNKLVTVIGQAIQTADEILGAANKLLNSVGLGTKMVSTSFPTMNSLLPNISFNIKVPIPQISCPNLPQMSNITDKEKINERNTTQAIKTSKLAIKSETLDKLKNAISNIANTVEQVTDAINTVVEAISEIERTITKEFIEPILNGISALEELGEELISLPSKIQFIAELDALGLDVNCKFNFNSGLAVQLGLDKIPESLKTAIILVKDTRNTILDTVDTICSINPSIHCNMSIPNDATDAAKFLGVTIPSPDSPNTIPVYIEILPKSTTEPVG